MFVQLEEINYRPTPFESYTAEGLWTDEHTSKQMLKYHLNEDIDVSSRNKKFIDQSVKWMTSYFGIGRTTDLIDFGCGPGLYTSRLAKTGAKVTGIDFSKRSIDYAKKKASEEELRIDYFYQNYLSFDTDNRYDLITLIMCDYCALSPKQRNILLQKFYNLLKPDGFIILDVYSLNAFFERKEQSIYEYNLLNGFWSAEKYYGFLNTFKYDTEKVVLDKYTIIEKKKIRIIYNWLQYYSRDTLLKEFEKNDLQINGFYSDVAGSKFDLSKKEMAIIAKKAT